MLSPIESGTFDGRAVLVTGAGGGIGRAVVDEFMRLGASVVASDIRATEVPDGARTVACDVRDESAVRGLVEEAAGEAGLSVLVHCTGILDLEDLQHATLEGWNDVIAVNLTSAFLLLQAAIPRLTGPPPGSVVIVGSLSGQTGGLVCGPAYAASKGGLHTLARWAARTQAPTGVRVNVIAPGPIDTNMAAAGGMSAQNVPLGRLGRPDEVARLAGYLASDAAGFMTGQVIGINGGTFIG
jgi:NAD(P)-dependent dehydrogenase (short-subunit alcohol dehydrogenase family)